MWVRYRPSQIMSNSWKVHKLGNNFTFHVDAERVGHGTRLDGPGHARTSLTHETPRELATRTGQNVRRPYGLALHRAARAWHRKTRILHFRSARMKQSGSRLARRTDTTAMPWAIGGALCGSAKRTLSGGTGRREGEARSD